MSAIYDNWERLVAATLKKQQLWELFHAPSRSPSILSEASDFSSSFNSSSHLNDPAFDFSIPGSSSQSQRVLPKFVLISDFSPAFDVKDVMLVSAELLERGTFGSAYRATMANGVRIVVKRLKSIIISEQEFMRHMEIVGNIRHENVAPLRAYYSSEDERLMLYDYYGSRRVFALLHGQTGHVDWETRLKIAVGVAKGIAEIHSQDGGKFVHGNIKSSNIFLNPQEYGCVSDLGIVNMMSATFMPNALCSAPEVKSTHHLSQESDVYSFGILLFELLTRKSPVHVPGGPEAVDLVKLVSSVKSKIRASTVFDTDLLKHRAIREQIVKVLQIGISCVAKSPKKRPKMYDVMKMLEDLRMMREGSNVSLEGKLVFVEAMYPTFTFEDVLKAYDPKDWPFTLHRGDPYKHMEIIGRIRHGNVAELRAYYFSKKEVLLVYDYYDRPSLSHGTRRQRLEWEKRLRIAGRAARGIAHIHRQANCGHGQYLEWEKRLKIAVGAARGIAHIHKQANCKLVHGNIKPSNIFINGEGYGVVSTAGLTNVMYPTRQQASAYSAPELVNDNTNISQACDVYSFGVVLLQLLSDRSPESPKWNTNDEDDDNGLYHFVGRIQSISHYQWTVDPDISGGIFTTFLHDDVVLLQLAMDCVANDPDRRPKITKVVMVLEETRGIDGGAKQVMESRLKDFLDEIMPTMI